MALIKHTYRLKDGTQRQSDTWYYRFRYKGKTHFGSTDTTNKQTAARIEKQKYEEIVARHRLGSTSSITIKQAFDNLLDSVAGTNREKDFKSHIAKLLGLKKDARTKGNPIIAVFGFDGSRPFESLTDADAQSLVLKRRKEGSSNGTILVELSTLSKAIKVNKKLHPSPVIDFAALKKDNSIKPYKGKLRYLSLEEETALLAQLDPSTEVEGAQRGFINVEEMKRQRQDTFDFVTVLLDVGARYSEISKLPWKAVDLKARTISLYRPKVNNESTISMSDRVYQVLSRRRKEAPKTQEYVFTAKDGGHRKYAPKAFRSACKRAGIEGVSLKTVRKTFASKLVKAGLPILSVSKLLGHTSPAITASFYAHLSPNEASHAAVEILNKLSVTK